MGGMNTWERQWVAVSELEAAVQAGFLTQAEARLVVWSRLPELQQQAASTPPEIAAPAAPAS